jgi:hypothetical protein
MHKNIQQKVPPHYIINLMDITMQRLVVQALRVAHGLRGAFLSTTSKNKPPYASSRGGDACD